MSGYAVNVVALFGLALAVDYSLLMVNRFREERAAGHGAAGAVVRSVETAGRTITYLRGDRDGVAGRAVRVRRPDVQLAGHRRDRHHAGRRCSLALILIPALLAAWGSKIRPAPRGREPRRAFGRLARSVQRRPVAVAAGCAVGLVALAVPFLR